LVQVNVFLLKIYLYEVWSVILSRFSVFILQTPGHFIGQFNQFALERVFSDILGDTTYVAWTDDSRYIIKLDTFELKKPYLQIVSYCLYSVQLCGYIPLIFYHTTLFYKFVMVAMPLKYLTAICLPTKNLPQRNYNLSYTINLWH